MVGRVLFALIALFMCAASPARAEDFVAPTLENITNTIIRYGAININKDDVIDNYGILMECKIFEYFYNDDFKWQKARAALREKIRQDVATFPTSYAYDAELQLDRYDFKNKQYKFTEKTTIKNVNSFSLKFKGGIVCGNKRNNVLPEEFRIVLDRPIYVSGLPLGNKEAEAFLKRMKDSQNNDRIVYARFNLRVTYVAPLYPVEGGNQSEKKYAQKNKGETSGSKDVSDYTARLDARLDSVNFYEDKERTRLIYSYKN
ncbi:MAG: DUF4852 domain-containing protein [Alphaproteobacteria bacterium]|nr:DUF4852 domain-containing protein [Alphaproteobacteria bacterium]